MNLPDVTMLAGDGWFSAFAVAAAVAALAVSWHAARRTARERQRLDVMHRDLQVFAEASTRVADTLDHLLRGDVPEPEAPTSSRRYLLHQARERLERGETAEQVATQLALCEDERRLLEFLSSGGVGRLGGQAHVA